MVHEEDVRVVTGLVMVQGQSVMVRVVACGGGGGCGVSIVTVQDVFCIAPHDLCACVLETYLGDGVGGAGVRKGGGLWAVGGDGSHNLGGVGDVVGKPGRDASNDGENSGEGGLHFGGCGGWVIRIRYSAKKKSKLFVCVCVCGRVLCWLLLAVCSRAERMKLTIESGW